MGKLIITEEEKKHINGLYEQLGPLISSLGSRTTATPRFNLEKGGQMSGARRLPSPEGDTPASDLTCYVKNIHNLVNKCKKDESKYIPDNDAKYIAKQLYDAMNGLSFGGAFTTLEYLKKDNASKFCRVSNAFNYDNENLAQWIENEISLPPDIVWKYIEKHSKELYLGDACFTGA